MTRQKEILSDPSHHEKVTILKRRGIVLRARSQTIALDPKRATSCDYAFVSHAHIDHVHSPDGKSRIISSKETQALAKVRGYNFGDTVEEAQGVSLVDAGHILGSRAILVEDSVFYTGDISRRDRGFLKGALGIKCDTLIMETTYGLPRYVFNETDKIVSHVSKIIADCFDKCRPVVLTGYPLGKAQLITYLFRYWSPVYLHESVHRINEAHVELGVDIPQLPSCETTNDSFLRKRPWIVIAPAASARSSFIKSLREKYNALIIAFTGWALDPHYRFMVGADYAFDLSDHCDFKELVDLAKYCNPSKVYTVHGFAREFADHLNYLGFDAEPLESDGQTTLSSY
jgi:putative mRNA 3-end processing factor